MRCASDLSGRTSPSCPAASHLSVLPTVWVGRTARRPADAVMGFTVTGGKIVESDALSDSARLRRLDLTALEDGPEVST